MTDSFSPQPKAPTVFIGSSGESKSLAAGFQVELRSQVHCRPKRWDQDVFDPSSFTLEALVSEAATSDFAVFIASPDDVTISRGSESPSVRDNVIFEFALFAGVVGLNRTYLMTENGKPLKLPSDIHGLTQVSYEKLDDSEGPRDACTEAAYKIARMITKHGLRTVPRASPTARAKSVTALDNNDPLVKAGKDAARIRRDAQAAGSELVAACRDEAMKEADRILKMARHELVRESRGAIAMVEKLLRDQVRILGSDHPDTLDTRRTLARWREFCGDRAEAATITEELLADQLRIFGPDHPDTLATRRDLAHRKGRT